MLCYITHIHCNKFKGFVEARHLDTSEKIVGAIGIVIITIVLLALTPVVVDAVQAMNTTGWNFTGKDGAIALLGLVPFVWIAGVLISACVGMFALAKSGGGKGKRMIEHYRYLVVRLAVRQARASFLNSVRFFSPRAFATK